MAIMKKIPQLIVASAAVVTFIGMIAAIKESKDYQMPPDDNKNPYTAWVVAFTLSTFFECVQWVANRSMYVNPRHDTASVRVLNMLIDMLDLIFLGVAATHNPAGQENTSDDDLNTKLVPGLYFTAIGLLSCHMLISCCFPWSRDRADQDPRLHRGLLPEDAPAPGRGGAMIFPPPVATAALAITPTIWAVVTAFGVAVIAAEDDAAPAAGDGARGADRHSVMSYDSDSVGSVP